jgi:hypothetical protein
VISGLLVSTSASAQQSTKCDPTSESSRALTEPQPEPASAYYGWQILLTDAIGVSLLLLSQKLGNSSIPAFIGAGSLLIGAPVLHAVHHNWLGLGVSLGMRLGTGLAFVGGLSLVLGSDGDGSTGGFVLLGGSVLGALATVVLDAALLGVDRRRPHQGASRCSLTPHLDPRGELGLQLSATF